LAPCVHERVGDNALTEIATTLGASSGLSSGWKLSKLIWPSFRDFSFDPECMPTPWRSLRRFNRRREFKNLRTSRSYSKF
jgi:hypothetical protein